MMTKNYVLETMSKEDYHKMMMGSNEYLVERVIIKANNAIQAIEKAKEEYKERYINENYVLTEEQLKEKEEKIVKDFEQFCKREEEKKANAKAKREQNELAKAEELGLTVAEYRQKVNKERQIKKLENEIANLKKALYYKEKALANLKK